MEFKPPGPRLQQRSLHQALDGKACHHRTFIHCGVTPGVPSARQCWHMLPMFSSQQITALPSARLIFQKADQARHRKYCMILYDNV